MLHLGLRDLVGEALAVLVGDQVPRRVNADHEVVVLAVLFEVPDGPADHLVHVPQVGAHRLRHPDPVAGVARVAVEVHRRRLQGVDLDLVVPLVATAGQHHPAPRPHLGSVGGPQPGHPAGLVLDEPVGRAAVPDPDPLPRGHHPAQAGEVLGPGAPAGLAGIHPAGHGPDRRRRAEVPHQRPLVRRPGLGPGLDRVRPLELGVLALAHLDQGQVRADAVQPADQVAAIVAQARDTAGGIIPPAQRSMYAAARSTSLTPITMPPDMYVLGVCRSSGCFSKTMTEAPWSAAAIAQAAPAPPKPTTTMSASSRSGAPIRTAARCPPAPTCRPRARTLPPGRACRRRPDRPRRTGGPPRSRRRRAPESAGSRSRRSERSR